ncbi:MAG: SHOCT domain-containing protein [Candidatus Nitrosopolaris sp.]
MLKPIFDLTQATSKIKKGSKDVFSRILLGYFMSGVLINFNSHISNMGIMRAAMIGHVAGRSARRQMEGMQQQAQAQQAQSQAQAQAAQAQAQAQQAQQAQAQAKTDPMQEIAKLGDLKAKGLITEEEFQKMKASVLAKM